ncbi:hypothetical protein N7530_004256 [Penicillium desertorum]|uniref:Uncharacterized protein n=1 Tax=Penicillium desertorum TaxID=1303715 RepID=A0A9X0BQL4_9EURO|nr:hypothetical protein N7530_004256 [Penicillium desertorum]
MLLYTTGGKGSIRYIFIHGNHEISPFSDEIIVDAKIVVFTGRGNIVYGDNADNSSTKYSFSNGVCTHVNGEPNKFVPARDFTELLLKNVSIPTLIMVEIPTLMTNMVCCFLSSDQIGFSSKLQDDVLYLAIMVYGRSDRASCSLDDRVYLGKTMRSFVPYFVQSLSITSDSYLPGDAQTTCKEITDCLELNADEKELNEFIEVYRNRYFRDPSVPKEAILESCLLNILKMPFDLNSSIMHGLIKQ